MTPASGSFTLFVQGADPSFEKDSLPLFAFGSVHSGCFSSLSLFALNTDGPFSSGSLPLFVKADGLNPYSGYLTLYAAGQTNTIQASLPLYVCQSGVAGNLFLYASGQGVNPGAYPLSQSLPFYVKRPEAAILHLYVQAQGFPASGSIPLYAQGCLYSSGVLNLIVPNVQGEIDMTVPLYACGW